MRRSGRLLLLPADVVDGRLEIRGVLGGGSVSFAQIGKAAILGKLLVYRRLRDSRAWMTSTSFAPSTNGWTALFLEQGQMSEFAAARLIGSATTIEAPAQPHEKASHFQARPY
jgi:hypothetical protein